jgi:hypothetical protein
MKWRHLFIAATLLIIIQAIAIANSSIPYVFAQVKVQYDSTTLTLIPGITQNILTVVSLLIGTSSFILGLRIQNLARPATTAVLPSITINKYMETLILALVIPSIFIIIFGIILVGVQLEIGDLAYLLLLFALFIPAGVILLLIRNLHRIPVKTA